MIEMVKTGGQTGVDQSGWRAARACGIPTGGWMPRGWITEDGPRPDFAEMYGATEFPSGSYPQRTRANIIETDATVLMGNPGSRGGGLALAICAETFTPVIVVPRRPVAEFVRILFNCPSSHQRKRKVWEIYRSPGQVAEEIQYGGFKLLNVAGNRESGDPGIGAWAESFLLDVFKLLQFEDVR